ncbi:MAG: hypothetical protein MUC69_08570 [Gemmatimonadales bacterium]|jgi:hypothetical protein|nr:hypothetical protein [Gemmatimonadales bacterium]
MPETPPLTTLMAEPFLRLLLAQEGHEPPRVPFAAAWHAFERFAEHPALHEAEGSSFQVEVVEGEGEEPVVSVLLVRQLTDPLDEGGARTRRVALQYLFPAPQRGSGLALSDRSAWRADHESWPGFAAEVEGTDEFRYAMATRPDHMTLFVEEDVPE